MYPVVIATHNAHKLQELQSLLQGLTLTLQLAPKDMPEVDETGLTFLENAVLKARNAAEFTGKAALADDSGIIVPYLKGAPGIYSARYAGTPCNDQNNTAKLLTDLKNVSEEKRQAFFYCCLVLMRHALDPKPIIAEGIWHGSILQAPKGLHGFGYDPVFWVQEKNCSAAELPPAEKNKISHRGLAIQQLYQKISSSWF